jgi:aspartyl-tRNA(Asn)/glutamyl-tRNA(Gln) amidotransferase subunit A
VGSKVNDPYALYLNDVYTLPASVAGLPAISLPCGESEGLPVGLQIIGNFFDEPRIIQAAHAFEQSLGWSNKVAPL